MRTVTLRLAAAGLLIVVGGGAIAATLQPGFDANVQLQPFPVHYKGGSHCHPNCIMGKCNPVCHCRSGKTWYTVQGPSCARGKAQKRKSK